MISSRHCHADASREMNVGRRDNETIRRLILDTHDGVERMFQPLRFLLIAHRESSLLVSGDERPGQCKNAGGVTIVDAMTRLEQRLLRSLGPLYPLPSTIMKYSAASRTDGRPVQLTRPLVGIEDAIPLSATPLKPP